MSAESNRLSPPSRHTSTRRVASATSLAPQALKNSLPPPKVPVPRLSTGTLNPEPPSCLYSIESSAPLESIGPVDWRTRVGDVAVGTVEQPPRREDKIRSRELSR